MLSGAASWKSLILSTDERPQVKGQVQLCCFDSQTLWACTASSHLIPAGDMVKCVWVRVRVCVCVSFCVWCVYVYVNPDDAQGKERHYLARQGCCAPQVQMALELKEFNHFIGRTTMM